MNTIECIKSRRSVREFTEQKVIHSNLNQIIEEATLYPCWKKAEISRYVVLADDQIKNSIM